MTGGRTRPAPSPGPVTGQVVGRQWGLTLGLHSMYTLLGGIYKKIATSASVGAQHEPLEKKTKETNCEMAILSAHHHQHGRPRTRSPASRCHPTPGKVHRSPGPPTLAANESQKRDTPHTQTHSENMVALGTAARYLHTLRSSHGPGGLRGLRRVYGVPRRKASDRSPRRQLTGATALLLRMRRDVAGNIILLS